VQVSLFDSETTEAGLDLEHDPYEELRAAAVRLTEDYVIDTETAMQAVIAFGSESGARRILRQQWWSGEIEMRTEREAA
jgi:hypothetical protein